MKKLMALTLTLIVSISCFKPAGHVEAIDAFQQKRWDEAVTKLAKMVLEHPDNIEYKVKLEMAKSNASKYHALEGKKHVLKRQFDLAAKEYNTALMYDPGNQYIYDELNKVAKEIEKIKQKQSARSIDEIKKESIGNTGVTILDPTSDEPIGLYFPQKTSLRKIYQSLGSATGINILFDSSFQDEQIDIDLRGMVFYDALKALMIASGNFYKVIDTKTVIILRDTKQNHEKYDDKIIKTYYLSYAKPDELKNSLRLMTGIKEIFEDKDINCVVVMGTAQQIAISDRIVALTDKPNSEVVVDFELMEVNRSNADKLGILPVSDFNGTPAYKIGAGLFNDSTDSSDSTSITPGFTDFANSSWQMLIPFLQIDFLKSIGEVKDVASPTLRVSEGETGKVLIGQSVPVATTSFTPFTGATSGDSSYYGTGGQPLTSYNYQEVGIKIEAEPRVHHNGDISLKLKLETSSIVDNREGFQPVIGKRTVETVLRVKSGETVIMAGLLKDSERDSMIGIKGLADIPVLRRLFSNSQKDIEQTDIMMTITPHIVRGPNIVASDTMPFVIGSQVESNFAPHDPFATKSKKAQETVEDNITKPADNTGQPLTLKPAEPAPAVVNEKQKKQEAPLKPESTQKNFSETSLMPAMISFSPRKTRGKVGETCMQSLFATNFRNVDSMDIVLVYDPETVHVMDVVDGGFMGEDGVKASFIPVWDNKTGKLALTIDRLGSAKGRSGTGILANIICKGIKPGTQSFTLQEASKMMATDGAELQFNLLEGQIEIK